MQTFMYVVPSILVRSGLVFAISLWMGVEVRGSSSLAELSLEELAGIPIVESAKKSEKLFDTPAGAYVFSQSDIENLPIDSIPELLRYAPGVHIMRSTNGSWGMGIRGMNSRFLSRTRFTVDDQSLYGTIFGGLFGSQHDLFMDDIASVEMVYGPGGSLWGPNSANGQVNVVLKSAFETEGNLLRMRVGTEQTMVAGRLGWSTGEDSAFRVSAKASDRRPSESDRFEDDWDTWRFGVQYDTRPSSSDLFTVSAEAYRSDLGFSRSVADLETGETLDSEGVEFQQGFNAQTRWTHRIDSENGYVLRAWTGYTEMRAPYADYDLGILGLAGRARYVLSERGRLTLSSEVSVDDEVLYDNDYLTFAPGYDENNINAHVAAEYTYRLLPERLEASVGMAAQYDTFADSVDGLPSVRLLFRPSRAARIWASFSRSTRSVPNGVNDYRHLVLSAQSVVGYMIETPYGWLPIESLVMTGTSDDEMDNEELDTFEIGYRQHFGDRFSLVATAFHNEYDNLFGATSHYVLPVLSVPSPYLEMNALTTNVAKGESTGFEIAWKGRLSERLEASLSYAYIEDHFEALEEYAPYLAENPVLLSEISSLNGNVPPHLFAASVFWKPFDGWSLDLGLRYSAGYESDIWIQDDIFQGDVKLSWTANDSLSLSLVGRNLLDPRTDESNLKDSLGYGTEIVREVSLELKWEF